MHKNLLTRIGEAIDQHRAEMALTEAVSTPHGESKAQRILRWWMPNPGTLVLVLALLFAVPALARTTATPAASSVTTIPYQGRLADLNGNPVTDRVNMEFRLYDVPTGGTPLWEEFWTGGNAVNVSDGLFSVMLGSIDTNLAQTVQGHDTLYLGITVGTDSEMSPRVQLGSVPFSVWSLTVADDSITAEKIASGAVGSDAIADGAVGAAEIATDAVGSDEIADGGIAEPDMGFRTLKFLGQKTCHCDPTTESGVSQFVPAKGTNTQDLIETTVTTTGGYILANMSARYKLDSATSGFCAVRVLQNGTVIRIQEIAGHSLSSSTPGVVDFTCSGSTLFVDLPAGTYTIQAVAWVPSPDVQVEWGTYGSIRQIFAMEVLP